jgi:hypothetical protein
VASIYRTLLLRQQPDPIRELAKRSAGPGHHPEDLERGDDPVARGRVLEDDHVAALLAAEAGPRDLHPLEDVLVADGRPDDLAAGRLDRGLEPAVRQDGHDERALGRTPRSMRSRARSPSNLVAVHDLAGRIDRDQPVGVAVEGEPDVGPAGLHFRRQ